MPILVVFSVHFVHSRKFGAYSDQRLDGDTWCLSLVHLDAVNLREMSGQVVGVRMFVWVDAEELNVYWHNVPAAEIFQQTRAESEVNFAVNDDVLLEWPCFNSGLEQVSFEVLFYRLSTLTCTCPHVVIKCHVDAKDAFACCPELVAGISTVIKAAKSHEFIKGNVNASDLATSYPCCACSVRNLLTYFHEEYI